MAELDLDPGLEAPAETKWAMDQVVGCDAQGPIAAIFVEISACQ